MIFQIFQTGPASYVIIGQGTLRADSNQSNNKRNNNLVCGKFVCFGTTDEQQLQQLVGNALHAWVRASLPHNLKGMLDRARHSFVFVTEGCKLKTDEIIELSNESPIFAVCKPQARSLGTGGGCAKREKVR